MAPEERANALIERRVEPPPCDGYGELVEVCSLCLVASIRAAERDARRAALEEQLAAAIEAKAAHGDMAAGQIINGLRAAIRALEE